MKQLRTEQAPERWLAVVVPELFQTHWYEGFLHNDRSEALRAAVLALKDPRVVVISVPWYLEDRDSKGGLLHGKASGV